MTAVGKHCQTLNSLAIRMNALPERDAIMKDAYTLANIMLAKHYPKKRLGQVKFFTVPAQQYPDNDQWLHSVIKSEEGV